jgi:hypothetical protein
MKITLTLALTLAAGSAFAQQPAAPSPSAQVADSRFAAWIGCWRLDDDLAGTGARMCITPEKAGVRMQTVVGTQRGIDEVVIADAVAHPISDSECKGTELAEWSSDGARVFRTTNVTCGKEPARTIKSVAFLAPGPSWISVQHVSGSAVNTAVRVQRYRRAANQTLADGSKAPQPEAGLTLRTTAETTKWSIEDVIEASGKVPAEAVQAALSEANHGFDLNKRTLLALDESGVHEQVIDLMVALTYPKRFVVERRGGGSAPSGILTGNGWFDPMMSPMMLGAYADCFSPFGYGYRSYYSACNMAGYSPLGYDYYGYNRYGMNGYYGYGGWVDIGAVPQHIGSVPGEPQGDGRAVNGRGYTQVRSRDSEGTPRVNSGSNGSAAGWSGNNGGASSSGGYSSGSSSSGSSGGSSGGDSGARVAVPKGGGE